MSKYLALLLIIVGCQPQLPPYEVPIAIFDDIILNLNLPSYSDVTFEGNAIQIDGGVRGIILYHGQNNEYRAFERNCSYQPADACATVGIDASNLFMFDSCCGSSFSFTKGDPISGPAFYPLRQYRVYLDGSILTITDTPIEF